VDKDELEKVQEIVAGGIEAAGLGEIVLSGEESAAQRLADAVSDEAVDRMIADMKESGLSLLDGPDGLIGQLTARLAELCRKYGIAELAVFGSVARGDAGPDSDVDLLYVRVPGNDLGMAYFDLQEDLERLFGRRVVLVAKDGLHRVIRDQVLADAQVLYAA